MPSIGLPLWQELGRGSGHRSPLASTHLCSCQCCEPLDSLPQIPFQLKSLRFHFRFLSLRTSCGSSTTKKLSPNIFIFCLILPPKCWESFPSKQQIGSVVPSSILLSPYFILFGQLISVPLGPQFYIRWAEASKEPFASLFLPLLFPDLFLQGPGGLFFLAQGVYGELFPRDLALPESHLLLLSLPGLHWVRIPPFF